MIVASFILFGFLFNISRNYKYNDYKELKNKLGVIIKKINSQRYQLNDIINQLNVNINGDLINSFNPKLLLNESGKIIVKLKELPKNGVETVKRLREGEIFVKRSLVSYKQALDALKIKNYNSARIQLKFVSFYLNKAHKKIFNKSKKWNFVNPFKRI